MSAMPSLELEDSRLRNAYGRRDAQRDARLYSYFNRANLFIIQERERRMLALLARHGLSDLSCLRILEIGCGCGYWIRQFVQWGAKPKNLAGVDVLPLRIADARRLCPSGAALKCQNAAQLDFAEGSFDLVLASTVFSSILDASARKCVAAEMLRVLRPSGAILWYDFFVDNPANHDVKGVRKGQIRSLFPGCGVHAERITLAPPLARRLAGFSLGACRALGALRFLDTHYLALIERVGARSGRVIHEGPEIEP